jgi:hypothetical protein
MNAMVKVAFLLIWGVKKVSSATEAQSPAAKALFSIFSNSD